MKLQSTNLGKSQENILGPIRLVLALFVLVSHLLILGGFLSASDRGYRFAEALGSFAVHCFFAISGFVIAASYHSDPSSFRFLTKRICRIMPAYWIVLLATWLLFSSLVILFDLTDLNEPNGDYSQRQSSISFGAWAFDGIGYVSDNIALLQRKKDLLGLTSNSPVPNYLNTSLWTLPWEFLLYCVVLFLGIVRCIKKRSFLLIAIFLAFYFNQCLDPTHYRFFGKLYASELAVRLPVYFLAGLAYWSWLDDFWRLSRFWPVFAVGGLLAASLGAYDVVMPFALPLALFPFACIGNCPAAFARVDLSYGVYLYATPVIRFLYLAQVKDFNLFLAVTLVVSLVFAWLSWKFVESPCIGLGKKFCSRYRDKSLGS